MHKNNLKKIAISKYFTLVGLLLLTIFFGKLKYKQYLTQKTIEKEKNILISQNNLLTQKNQELSDSLSYLNSENFKEKIAREKLNLKKDGEIIYSFSETNQQLNDNPTNDLTPERNYIKWLHYFFGKN